VGDSLDGTPNVSPKGSFTVWDDNHLALADRITANHANKRSKWQSGECFVTGPCWRKADLPTVRMNVPCRGAGSTGRRVTGAQSLCWVFELHGLMRLFV
jgi:hypothetical protein